MQESDGKSSRSLLVRRRGSHITGASSVSGRAQGRLFRLLSGVRENRRLQLQGQNGPGSLWGVLPGTERQLSRLTLVRT